MTAPREIYYGAVVARQARARRSAIVIRSFLDLPHVFGVGSDDAVEGEVSRPPVRPSDRRLLCFFTPSKKAERTEVALSRRRRDG